MRLSDLPLHPPHSTLRQFAVLWIVFFGGLGCWRFFALDHTWSGSVLIALGLTVGPVGTLFPRLMRPIFAGWLLLVFPIGWLVSRSILALLFFGIFAPLGLVFRMIGRDELRLRRRPDRDTYWELKDVAPSRVSYLRQY